MHTAYLNIGANIGAPRRTIWQAVKALTSVACDGRVECSDIIITPAWGYDSPNPYHNIGVRLHTTLKPLALLDALQQIERRLGATPHRAPDGTYIDRTLDIDIIAIDDLHIDTPRLTLPHPRAHLRTFVTTPLRQLGYPYQITPRTINPPTGTLDK